MLAASSDARRVAHPTPESAAVGNPSRAEKDRSKSNYRPDLSSASQPVPNTLSSCSIIAMIVGFGVVTPLHLSANGRPG